MPDSDRMMYQTPFWSSVTMGRDIYAPTREAVTRGKVNRWVLPEYGAQGWPVHYSQPAAPDPNLRRMGYQQTGTFGGPAGRAELYRGAQMPPIGVPIGFGDASSGSGRAVFYGGLVAVAIAVGLMALSSLGGGGDSEEEGWS